MQVVGTIVTSALEAAERAKTERAMHPVCTCQPCPLRDEDVCDEAEAAEGYDIDELFAMINRQYEDSLTSTVFASAAFSVADPPPTVPNVVGGEGGRGASGILQPAPLPQPTSPAADSDGRSGGADSDTSSDTGARRQQGDQPDLGDLAEFIYATFRGPYLAGDKPVDRVARELLAEFHITRK
ncbi:hypothetical protein A5731_00585 [Mycolicibacterium conceptionense]|nr:hypothetical protein A5718_29975 [Mycolicibacterium conceptionense]OBF09239.1 hypothetical protein A5731_00585 [Mycolicibacterium conceptionense]